MDEIIVLALAEDIGSGDVSASLLPKECNKIVSAQIICREKAVICGLEYCQRTFTKYDENTKIDWKIDNGDEVFPNMVLCIITGLAGSILTPERTALNFLQTLSATATQTANLCAKISHTSTKLLDTRKTLPLLRLAQKQAVVCGGGVNHRLGLYDCVMLKENHITALGGLEFAIEQAKQSYPDLPLVVEVENLNQLSIALNYANDISRILCDNFSPSLLTKAVKLSNNIVPLEASGNINLDTIVAYAETGVAYISTGSITKNIQAIDLSLRIQ